jgi:hypothetical protein
LASEKEVKSFKVTPEFKQKLKDIISESGFGTEDQWLEHVATEYELNQMKEIVPGYKKILDELQYHKKREAEIFLSILNTESAERFKQQQEYEGKAQAMQLEITGLNERIQLLVSQYQEMEKIHKALGKEKEGLEKTMQQAEQLQVKNNLLVDEYKEKNDTLLGMVKQGKEAVDQRGQLQQEVDRLTKLTESLNRKIEMLEKQQENDRETYHRDIERIAKEKELEREQVVLKLKIEMQERIDKEREEGHRRFLEMLGEVGRPRRQQDVSTEQKE